MRVIVDTHAGFCFGVSNAIAIAETVLEEGEGLLCLGELVHNEEEMNQLTAKGIKTIDHEALKTIKDQKVLLRAHGEPPVTYLAAYQNNIHVIDATCPIVRHLQKKVKACYEGLVDDTGQIVIFGKKGHPETIGLTGQTNGKAIVISSIGDVALIDPAKDVYLFAQTTMSPAAYDAIEIAIAGILAKAHSVYKFNTICRQMSQRTDHLQKFAKSYDMVLFISGRNSSNGKYLFGVCKAANPASFQISNIGELQHEWFAGIASIGITGATSTSQRQLDEVADWVKRNY